MTPADFLAWESDQQGRHEFVDGEIFAMVGGTLNHNLITLNLVRALDARLPPRCRVYVADVKVQVGKNFFYPDVVSQCGHQDGASQVVERPGLIAEVESPSTAEYDQSVKWQNYERLPTLQSYLLIAQDRIDVRIYRRSGAGWLYTTHHTLDDTLELTEPALSLPLRELYAGIEGLDPAAAL